MPLLWNKAHQTRVLRGFEGNVGEKWGPQSIVLFERERSRADAREAGEPLGGNIDSHHPHVSAEHHHAREL